MPIPGGNIQALAAAQQSGSRGLIAFAVDPGGSIWAVEQSGPGGAWGGWQGPKFQNQPAAALQVAAAGQNNGLIMLVMLDEQGMVWTLAQNGPGSWGGWQGPNVGRQPFSWQSICAAQQGGSRGIEIWAADFNDQIWTLYQTSAGGAWSSWEGPGFKGQSALIDTLAAAGQNNGNVMLFALDLDDQVWAIPQGSPGGDWGAWSGPNVGGEPQPYFSIVAAEQGGNRGVEVWALDRNGQISTLYQVTPGGAWSSWEGPGFKNQPTGFLHIAAAGQNDGNVMLLAVSKDGQLWYVGQQWPGGDWGAWTSIAGPPGGIRAGADVLLGHVEPEALQSRQSAEPVPPRPEPAQVRQREAPIITATRIDPARRETESAKPEVVPRGVLASIRRIFGR